MSVRVDPTDAILAATKLLPIFSSVSTRTPDRDDKFDLFRQALEVRTTETFLTHGFIFSCSVLNLFRASATLASPNGASSLTCLLISQSKENFVTLT